MYSKIAKVILLGVNRINGVGILTSRCADSVAHSAGVPASAAISLVVLRSMKYQNDARAADVVSAPAIIASTPSEMTSASVGRIFSSSASSDYKVLFHGQFQSLG